MITREYLEARIQALSQTILQHKALRDGAERQVKQYEDNIQQNSGALQMAQEMMRLLDEDTQ